MTQSGPDGTALDTSRAVQRRAWLNDAQRLRTALEYVEQAHRIDGGPYRYLHLGLCDELHDLGQVVQALRSDLRFAEAYAAGWVPPWEAAA